jgi:hypothetical protein
VFGDAGGARGRQFLRPHLLDLLLAGFDPGVIVTLVHVLLLLFSAARSLLSGGNDGPRGVSKARVFGAGPEPRGATRRRFFGAEHGEHGEDLPFDTARPWVGITIEEQRRLSSLLASSGPVETPYPVSAARVVKIRRMVTLGSEPHFRLSTHVGRSATHRTISEADIENAASWRLSAHSKAESKFIVG